MKIVFLDEYSMCNRDLSAIKSLGEYCGYQTTENIEQTIERCADAEIVITNKVVISREVIESLPHLRLICVAATGVNNIDIDAAKEHNIEVRNAVGYSTYSVAETTICSALGLLREVIFHDQYIKSGEYAQALLPFYFHKPTQTLRGKNWGIIGLGNIGREVAHLATAFGCKVSYCSTSGITRDEPYNRLELSKLLEWADVVSLHCPLNDQTRNLIGKEQLSQMKKSAIIINVARGNIIDEVALVKALNDNIISGAAIDVFDHEPMLPNNPLLVIQDPDKLLLSPHNAWSAVESIDQLIDVIAQNIIEYTA